MTGRQLRRGDGAVRLHCYVYNGFVYPTLSEAEAARERDGGGWYDGRRKVIWGPRGEAL